MGRLHSSLIFTSYTNELALQVLERTFYLRTAGLTVWGLTQRPSQSTGSAEMLDLWRSTKEEEEKPDLFCPLGLKLAHRGKGPKFAPPLFKRVESVQPRGLTKWWTLPLIVKVHPKCASLTLGTNTCCLPWRGKVRREASAYRTEDPGFESRQGVRFLEIYTLHCNCAYLRKINV
jgi:hypothetical protein